jgi:hypothetical protein
VFWGFILFGIWIEKQNPIFHDDADIPNKKIPYKNKIVRCVIQGFTVVIP